MRASPAGGACSFCATRYSSPPQNFSSERRPPMRKTRFMSLFFLVLSLAFLFVPAFRLAFQAPLSLMELERKADVSRIPGGDYDRWAQEAQSARDLRSVAFVALHHPDLRKAMTTADWLTQTDPHYGWVYLSLANRLRANQDSAEYIAIKKLQVLDFDNALGDLLEGEYI